MSFIPKFYDRKSCARNSRVCQNLKWFQNGVLYKTQRGNSLPHGTDRLSATLKRTARDSTNSPRHRKSMRAFCQWETSFRTSKYSFSEWYAEIRISNEWQFQFRVCPLQSSSLFPFLPLKCDWRVSLNRWQRKDEKGRVSKNIQDSYNRCNVNSN